MLILNNLSLQYMKKLYGFLLISLLCFHVQAQITILSSDMPVLADTLRYSTSNSDITSLINQSGANQTWNASAIIPEFQDIAAFKSAMAINPVFAVSFSNASYGTAGQQAFNLGVVAATESFDFYKNSTANYVVNGRGFSIQGIPLSQTWRDTMFRFPLVYGNTDSNVFVSNEVNAVIATLRHVGKRVNTVDGWGSIITPYGTFECIRVKSVLKTVDTLKTTLIPIPIPIPQNVTEYKWYAKNKKLPILEIDVTSGAGAQTTVRYRDIARPEVFVNTASFNSNKDEFPANTNTDTCVLTDNSSHPAKNRLWTITPNTFQFTGGTNANSPQAKVFFTQPGDYTVKLNVVYNAGKDDTTMVDRIHVVAGGLPLKADFEADKVSASMNDKVIFTDKSSGNPTGWNWSFDPQDIQFVNGTTNLSQHPEVRFIGAGFYTVTLNVQDNSGSDKISKENYIYVFTTGLASTNGANDFVVYPNPAGSKVEIKTDAAIDLQTTIMDITGKMVMTQQGNQLDISSVPNGYYVMKIYANNGEWMASKPLLIAH